MNTLIEKFGKQLGLKGHQAPFKFHGGLALAPAKRALNANLPDLAVPPLLVLPLIDYNRQTVAPIVNTGDSVLRGQLLASGVVAPSSGLIQSIEFRQTLHPDSLAANSIVLQSDGRDARIVQHQNHPDKLNELIEATTSANAKQALHLFDQLALSGLGGAGFPTAQKLLNKARSTHTLIINAAECEPEIACDEALMQLEANAIANGIDAAAKLVQCKTCVLAIEESKPAAIESMSGALQSIDTGITLMVIPTRYPTGAESPLIECVTGQSIPHNEKPSDHGIVCINVATAHALWQALNNQPLDSRIISLGGSAMPNPCNVRVRFGTPVEYILRSTGNESCMQTGRIRAGGPLSGFDINTLTAPVTVKTNCILAEPQTNPITAQACIRCGNCADVCPSRLLPQQLHWYAMADNLPKCEQLKLDACIECGCCDLVCPASIKLTETFRYAKSQIKQLQDEQEKATAAEKRYVEREARVLQREQARGQAIEQRKKSIKTRDQTNAEQIKAALARASAKRKPNNQ